MYYTAIAVADLSSHGMCVSVGYVLEPGNEMSQTRWNPEGVCVIHRDDNEFRCF